MKSLSWESRNESIAQMKATSAENPFDVLIIGGGITGAGLALDGAVRGLKTALIEKRDFAAGTSSRSTKLILADCATLSITILRWYAKACANALNC